MHRRPSDQPQDEARAPPCSTDAVPSAADAPVDEFCALLDARTGLRTRDENAHRLARLLEERARARGLPDAAAYVTLLANAEDDDPEWNAIVDRVTVGESYFFRDPAQFAILRDHVLPERLAARGSEGRVRVWSAGCARGEEAYSLAILADELFGRDAPHRVEILATDLNPEAVRAAREGVYRPWALRALDPRRRAKYFTERDGAWVIDDALRERVRFRTGNLVKDACPDARDGLADLDVILCRNVFIYFRHATVAAVTQRLAAALADGGYLVTGHAEITGARPAVLAPRLFPGSVAYQRAPARAPATATPSRRVPTMRRARTRSAPPRRERADAPDLLARAQAAADRGGDAEARALCARVLEQDPFSLRAYHLLARLAEEANDHAEAKRLLRKATYVAPTAPGAFLELAFLYERERDHARAAHMRRAARDALSALPPDAPVEPYDGVTAAEVAGGLAAGEPEEEVRAS